MIRKSGSRFSEKHALGLDPRDHAPPKKLELRSFQAETIEALGMGDQQGDAGDRGRRQRTDQCGLDEGN
jgi:hypothetical protein